MEKTIPLKIYNTLTRKKESFEPITQKEVKMYSCGPTVYNYPHIGNYRAYITADILRRVLGYNGYKVKQIMNITDVDDKTIRDSRKKGISLKEFTEGYTKVFLEEMKKLNIIPADKFPRATDHIEEMVSIISGLLKKKIAYKGEDGSIYYSISKFKNYGKLAHLKFDGLKEGARVKQDDYTKEAASDFALWKAYDESDGEVFWESKLGKGRPGWHIECSAMSTKYLGESFDIHTGGVDLIFPHHQNEIAQIEPVTKKKFVNYWVHNEWLLVDGKKMSKSLKNFYMLKDIINQGYDPLHFRYLVLLTHYKKPFNFTFENMDAAKTAYERIKRKVIELKSQEHKGKDLTEHYSGEFLKAVNDDVNLPKAIAVFFNTLEDFNFNPKNKIELIEKFDEVLGLGIKEMHKIDIKVPTDVAKLIEEREKLRKEKEWAKADIIRQRIKERGYELEDTPNGSKAVKIIN